MAVNPTIIVGHLNDKELKDSIDQLVQHVDQGTKTMVESFNRSIEAMKQKLAELSKEKVDLGVTMPQTTTARRKKESDEETKAVKETTVAYQQLANAMQMAQPKSARESYLAFMKGYREQAQAIEEKIKAEENRILSNQIIRVENQDKSIALYINQIRELQQEIQKLYATPQQGQGWRQDVASYKQEIERLKQKIVEAEKEKERLNNAPLNSQELINLRQEHQRISNIMRDETKLTQAQTQAQQQANAATTQQIEEQDRLTRKIQRQAEIIRQRMAAEGGNNAQWGNAVIYREGYNQNLKKTFDSIESQLLEAHKASVAAMERQARLKATQAEYQQRITESTQQQAQVEKQITQEQEKRPTVQPKTFQNYEDFRSAIAHVLGLQRSEVKLANEQTASYNQLANTLKQLQTAYNKLNSSERNSDNGKALVSSMHEVENAMRRIKSQASRYNWNEIIGMPEKTLDDIAMKMQALQRYRGGIDLTSGTKADEINKVNLAYDKLKKTQEEVLGANKKMLESNNALSRSFNYMKNRLAFYFTVGASTQFVKTLYDIRSQYELLERSIGILVDSAQQGTQIFSELNAMAIKSPFTTMELGAAAKQLVAYDIAAKDVVETTKRIGDIAAAAGIPMERLTYSLGHIKAFGYLNARDARMWANAGIPLVKNLADRYTELEGRLVSVSDVYDRIKKKSVGFEDVLDVIHSMTDEGGKFFNFQEKAADTMKVKLANLTLAMNNMFNEIGKSYQSALTAPLSILKTLYENWRKISNGIYGVVFAYGALKVAQLLNIILTQRVGLATAASDMMTAKWVGRLYALRGALLGVAFNPFTWVAAAVGVFTYLINEYIDLNRENDKFNQSLRDNSEENIKSINKFFEDYNDHLKNIGNDSLVNQQKMWERIQEEIEKTSKNAKNYVYELEKIPSITERIKKGIEVLSQSQYIQKQIKDMASHGLFSIGGGFANESLAQDLKEYEENMNRLIRKFGDLQKAREHFGGREKTRGDINWKNQWGEYMSSLRAVQGELNDFEKTLDRVRTKDIMGDGTNFQKLENLREFAYTIRDNFLATEQGSKIGVEGQALLNSMIDEWVSKQAFANKLISQQQSIVEKNRGAWEIFFSHLKEDERKSLDFLIETGKTSTKECEDIWTNAANRMKESSFAAYNQIQDDIAKLRATPDIVINVVYRQNTEKLDADQKQFVADFLTPNNKSSQKFYFEQQDELRTMYGRFQRKADEDYVEWEKRLGEEYRNNAESIKKLNKQLDENKNKSSEYYKAQKKQRDDLVETQTHLENVRDALGFDFEKEKKGKNAQKKAEDEVANALQKEIQLINEMRSNYDKLRKSGVSNMEAIDLASQGYEDTILRINNILGKYGINKFNASNFTGKDVRTLLNNLESQRKTLLASGKVKLASLQSLDVEIKKLSVDAKTYDMKKITEGLNHELGKLKEEYELAVELEANPELGDMFTDMLGVDVSGLPRTFEQVFGRANEIAKRELEKLGVDIQDFDILSTIIKGDANNRWMGLDMESEPIKELLKQQKTYRDMFKKNLIDTEKDLDDYVKKYGGYADKVVEIENNRLERLARLNNAYYTEEMRNQPEYIAKLRAINEGARRETSQVDFDEFKNSRYYTMMFENLEYVSTRSINAMRDKLLGLMDTMHELTPEQLKTVMQQYEKLEQTLVKRNPFKTLTKDLRNYIKTTSDRRIANKEFRDVQDEYDAQKKVVAELKVKRAQAIRNHEVTVTGLKKIDSEIISEQQVLDLLREQLEIAEKKANKYNMIKKLALEEAQQTVQMVNANIQSLGQLRDFIQDDLGVALGDELNGFVDGMTKASEGLNNIISSAQSGNVVGTALGIGQAVAGVFDGVASIFGDGAARTKRLNREIAKSEEAVRQLNMAYKELERTVDSAMGAEELRARRSEIANKRAQLAELERQMALEREKRSKDRDDEKIKQYEESIQDLRYEIEDLVDDIAGTLLGGGVKDAAESFVDTWVSAWREGGDTMDALKQKFDDMIDTMIAKSLASRLVAKRIQHIWDAVDMATNEESEGGAEITLNELQRLRELVGDKSIAERINEDLTNLYNALGIAYGVDSDTNKNLSNLQQGIQGITEDTAGAIEAYMNSVSQQVYLQSDLMMQIRDAVVGLDIDIQTATISQMLLQLQQSYAIQVAIQNTLNGALNPSGRAFMVELNS